MPSSGQLSFWLGEGVFLGSQNSKCQVLANFHFGWGRVLFLGSQNPKCQVLANFFHFREFGGRGGGDLLKNRVFLQNGPTILEA